MRTTRPSAQVRQASIISAAAALFADRGFNGTTTRQIAKAAGISEALLFKHFPTKRELYAAILAEKVRLSELLAAVQEAADKRDDVRVFTMIASFRIYRGADPSLLRLLLFSALEGHEYIARRTQDNAFRRVDPLLAAQSFIGMIVYHRLLHEIFKVPQHCSPEDAVSGYVDMFLSGLQKKPSGRKRSRRPGTLPVRCAEGER